MPDARQTLLNDTNFTCEKCHERVRDSRNAKVRLAYNHIDCSSSSTNVLPTEEVKNVVFEDKKKNDALGAFLASLKKTKKE